jgi:hypothetical protein
MKSAVLFLCALPLLAAIDGTVVNKTTGQPQAGVKITLTKLGQGGMQAGGSTTSGADGSFKLESGADSAHLLQALWQGVTYNVQLQPGSATTGLKIEVFDALPKVSAVDATQHMILIETDGQEVVVNETVIFQNDSQTTWYDPKTGSLQFTAPPEAGKDVKARAIAPGGMPVEREPKQIAKGVYAVDFPVKPGETRFDISYKLPAKAPTALAGKILHAPGPVRFVVPQGVTLEGDNLTALGNEPKSGAAIFDLKGDVYNVKISGSGTLRATESAASDAPAATDREEDGPRIQQILPPGYERQYKWALGLILAILALSFYAQYIKTPPSQGSKPKA